jgi:hypothetical protein
MLKELERVKNEISNLEPINQNRGIIARLLLPTNECPSATSVEYK